MYAQLITDKELISCYLKGNEDAIEALINRHKDRVFTYIVLLVKDKQLAEDMFQDTFFKVIQTLKRGGYKEKGKFLPWILRIAHNLIIDYYRISKRMRKADWGEDFNVFDVIDNGDFSTEQKMIYNGIHSDLRKLIELLPEKQKQVLIMRHFSKMSFKHIAEDTNVSINTSLGRMRYALIKLRKLIKEKQVDLITS